MSGLLYKIRVAAGEQRETALANYKTMVERVAAETDPSPTPQEVVAVIEAAGGDIDTFTQEVEARRARLNLLTRSRALQAAEEAEQKAQTDYEAVERKVQAELDAIDFERKKAEEKRQAKETAIRERLTQTKAVVEAAAQEASECRWAAGQLRLTAPRELIERAARLYEQETGARRDAERIAAELNQRTKRAAEEEPTIDERAKEEARTSFDTFRQRAIQDGAHRDNATDEANRMVREKAKEIAAEERRGKEYRIGKLREELTAAESLAARCLAARLEVDAQMIAE